MAKAYAEGGSPEEEIPQGPPLFIRVAVWDDVKAIKNIASSHKYTKHFSSPAYCNRPKFAAGDIFVALLDNKIIGFTVLQIRKRKQETELSITGVDKNYRRRGVAQAMFNYIKNIQPNPILISVVHKDNEAMLPFREKMGFVRVGEARNGDCWLLRYICKKGVLI